MLKGFKDFLFRGNVVDLAVAVVIGVAFAALVTSFTESFINPLIGLIGGGGVDGGIAEVNGQQFTWGAYFVIVVPMKKLQERRLSGQEPGQAAPTDVELLAEIRDLLAAQRGETPEQGTKTF